MRKLGGTLAVLVADGGGSVMLEKTLIPGLLDPPWIFIIFGLSVIAALVFWSPEIRRCFDPVERMMREYEGRRKREQATSLQPVQRAISRDPMLGKPRILDPARLHVRAPVRPLRTRRGWIMRRVAWLANHRMLPVPVFLWLGRKLGFKRRDDDG